MSEATRAAHVVMLKQLGEDITARRKETSPDYGYTIANGLFLIASILISLDTDGREYVDLPVE
jgi:hypothetical protein